MDTVEGELSRLIERRAATEPDPDELEPSYVESVRRYHARQRDQNRWAWVRYFDRMATNHSALAESYRECAQALCEEGEPPGA